MIRVLLVGAGGFIGSIIRYILSGVSQTLFVTSRFPVGTIVVNLSGCYLIGLLSQLAESHSALRDLSRSFLFIGVLGGYTTFSTFSNESLNLLRAGDTVLAIVNIALQVAGGLLFAWLGRLTAQLVWR